MKDNHFKAILAKNLIAAELGQASLDEYGHSQVNATYILSCLADIESFTGEGNQPNIHDSFTGAMT